MEKLIKDRYVLAVLLSFALSVVCRHFCVKQYRSEIGYNADESFEVVKNSSGAFFFEDNKTITVKPDKDHDEHEEDENHKELEFEKGGLKVHVHGPDCDHEHERHDEHKAKKEEHDEDSKVSPGLTLVMKQLGFAELAASFLWIQMDADSHKELWHRVDFELELIPALDPTFIEGFLLRSYILAYYRNDWEGGIYVLEKALKKIKNRSELWEQLGILCFNPRNKFGKERKLQRALEAFGTLAAFSDPPEYAARFYAQCLAAMGKRDEAVQILEQISLLNSRSEEAKKQDQDLIRRIKQGDKF